MNKGYFKGDKKAHLLRFLIRILPVALLKAL